MDTFFPPKLQGKFTQRAKNAIFAACKLSKPFDPAQGKPQPIHLLMALCQEKGSLAKNILETHKITSARISRLLNISNEKPRDLKATFKRATQIAAQGNQPYVGTEHLLYALIVEPDTLFGVISKNKIAQIKKHIETIFSQSVRLPDLFQNATSPVGFSRYARSRVAGQNKIARHRHQTMRTYQNPALDMFCQNLSALAEQKILDPLIGREKEIARIMHILSRRSKNNPLLIGEPGVGKTAIVQGLAQKINEGEVPANLLHKRIFSLNLTTLVAGTMFRGDFEARIHEILKEASRPDVILFIDEIHTVIGAGAAQGSLDVANILKPALSQGGMHCIGATTLEEYKKYLEKDRALERRFQPLIIEEEKEEQAIQTLANLKTLYEKHHGLLIGHDAIEAAVRLSSRYIPERFLPDKALDVLDEAASKLKCSVAITTRTKKIRDLERQKIALQKEKERAILQENYEAAIILRKNAEELEAEITGFRKKFPLFDNPPMLSRRDIEETVSSMSGVPLSKIESRGEEIEKIKSYLDREIIGQDEAVSSLIQTLKRNKAGVTDTLRPVGSFLFLGKSGVGKTALARALADAQNRFFLKLDMSEYSEPHTVSRLLGSPPGYVGYGEGGELTEKIRRNPYAVVLFDDIEKAHPTSHNLLLSLLEQGTLSDGTGRTVSFRSTIIILTSNASADDALHSSPLGFVRHALKENQENQNATRLEDIKNVLRPELLSRIDKIILFDDLGKKDIEQISKLHIQKLITRLEPFRLEISPRVIRQVAIFAYKKGAGGRYVRAAVEKMVEGPLAEYLIKHGEAKSARVDVRQGKIYVS